MTPGISGLAFLPSKLFDLLKLVACSDCLTVGAGAVLCTFIFVWYDNYLARAQKRQAPWAAQEEYRRLPLACLGGPLYVISLFWLAWSAYPHVHWIVPMMSGLFFGMGFLLIFMAILNYLTDAYQVFAASANGIASTCRSVFGALLPLAARPMYSSLGIHWAGSLLAFLSLGMAAIPFVFIKYGDRIRASSRFCQYLKELNEKGAAEEEEEEEGRRRSQMSSSGAEKMEQG